MGRIFAGHRENVSSHALRRNPSRVGKILQDFIFFLRKQPFANCLRLLAILLFSLPASSSDAFLETRPTLPSKRLAPCPQESGGSPDRRLGARNPRPAAHDGSAGATAPAETPPLASLLLRAPSVGLAQFHQFLEEPLDPRERRGIESRLVVRQIGQDQLLDIG